MLVAPKYIASMKVYVVKKKVIEHASKQQVRSLSGYCQLKTFAATRRPTSALYDLQAYLREPNYP